MIQEQEQENTGAAAAAADPHSPPAFSRCAGETPRAMGAFLAWFNLGPARSLPAVAGQLGEKLDSVKKWSSQYRWADRLCRYQAGLLQQQVDAQVVFHQEQAAAWARRTHECRQQEWEAAQKLRAVAQCFLETVGEPQIEKITLAQASRALQVAARLARQALSDAALPDTAVHVPIQLEIESALKKAFGSPAAPAASAPPESVGPGRTEPLIAPAHPGLN
ncbi:MAG: hypothetical protein WCH99_19270 [Verrucomicrobiota bacterium]